MIVQKFNVRDALFERSPGQDGEVYAANAVDQRHGGPITIGFGRYGPNETINETMAVDDVMIVLEGSLTVSSGSQAVKAVRGEIVHMPKGERVTISSHEEGALTSYVTYPHWQAASGE